MEESMSKAPGIGKAMAIQNAMTWFIGATAWRPDFGRQSVCWCGTIVPAAKQRLAELDRVAAFLDSRRDARVDLLKGGMAANLLAPSYSGNRQPDGGFGQAHLAELSVNYVAGLERLAEVCVRPRRNQAKPNAIVPLRPRSGKHCRVS